MTIKDKLSRIEELTALREHAVDQLYGLQDIKDHNTKVGRTPTHMQGLISTEEGFETPMSGTERVDFDFNLPAKTVRWAADMGRYHIHVETQGPALLDVYDEERGNLIVSKRRSRGVTILDVNVADARIESTQPIRVLHIDRFVSRTTGRLVLGPFTGKGRLTATAKGHGRWNAQVAVEPYFSGEMQVNPAPKFVFGGTVYKGGRFEDAQDTATYESVGEPWSAVRRVPNDTPMPDAKSALSFYDEVLLGRWVYDTEDMVVETPFEQSYTEDWWTGEDQWLMMPGRESPAFFRSPELWTYVWGSASGPISRVYDLNTGRRAQSANEGFYLIASQEPDQVEIEGWHANTATPVDSRYITAGAYQRNRSWSVPTTYFIEITGSGILRDVEVEETKQFGPGAKEITTTRRIDLADFSEAGDDNSTNMQTNDHGLILTAVD